MAPKNRIDSNFPWEKYSKLFWRLNLLWKATNFNWKVSSSTWKRDILPRFIGVRQEPSRRILWNRWWCHLLDTQVPRKQGGPRADRWFSRQAAFSSFFPSYSITDRQTDLFQNVFEHQLLIQNEKPLASSSAWKSNYTSPLQETRWCLLRWAQHRSSCQSGRGSLHVTARSCWIDSSLWTNWRRCPTSTTWLRQRHTLCG